MKKEKGKRVNFMMETTEERAILIILSHGSHGSISNAFREALSYILRREVLQRKGLDIVTKNFLTHEIREKIINGQSIYEIALELNEDRECPKKENIPHSEKCEKSQPNERHDQNFFDEDEIIVKDSWEGVFGDVIY